MVCIAKVFVVTFYHVMSFCLNIFLCFKSLGFRRGLGLTLSHLFSFSPLLFSLFYSLSTYYLFIPYFLRLIPYVPVSHLTISVSSLCLSLSSITLFPLCPSLSLHSPIPTSLSLSLEASWKHYNNIIITKMSPLCLGFHYHVRSPSLILFIYFSFFLVRAS